ncbi:17beta-estradiol 17-dehydrogenase / very-long-chain 3-oxoacyl-CoA reductase [Pancytospora epiphaga]|nr:17beta-estradiol 17-dehydrogenase / very-long-chain 3-oxoacyl-CoA reductase [Pancytospora epiphaga]
MHLNILQTLVFIIFLRITPYTLKYLYSWVNNGDVWEKLKNKWVLVTNANTVVGSAICRNLAARGCRLILTGANTDSLVQLHDSLLNVTDRIVYFNVDYLSQSNYSFIDEYDIGLVVNKIGFYDAEPAAFTDSDLDLFIDFNVRGPLSLLKAVVSKMTQQNQGYVLTLSFRFGAKPRAYYSLITAVKAMFRTLSESMYYELKESNVVFEYMETGRVSLREEDATLISPTVDSVVDTAFDLFGSSYYTIPYLPHFCEYYFLLMFLPKFIVARYRRLNIKRFTKQIFKLY